MKVIAITCFCIALAAFSHGVPAKTGRIIGGTPAKAGEFKFIAALYVHTANSRRFCTASMFDRYWFITAAQCVENAVEIQIHLGITQLSDPKAIIAVTDLFEIHPKYNNVTLDNDIALIKTRLPMAYSDYIGPIDLPSRELRPDSIVHIAGWGQTDDQAPAPVDHLHEVEVVAMSDFECKKVFGNWIVGHMVCVSGNYNQGTCRGDSGAPLIQYVNEWTPTIAGVSTFISSKGCLSTDPSGFTKIWQYLDWIRNVTLIPA